MLYNSPEHSQKKSPKKIYVKIQLFIIMKDTMLSTFTGYNFTIIHLRFKKIFMITQDLYFRKN